MCINVYTLVCINVCNMHVTWHACYSAAAWAASWEVTSAELCSRGQESLFDVIQKIVIPNRPHVNKLRDILIHLKGLNIFTLIFLFYFLISVFVTYLFF